MYDLEEQEQIDALKGWWKENQRLVFVVIVAAALAAGLTGGWKWYQRDKANAAGHIYSSLETALHANDNKQVHTLAQQLMNDYTSTVYASMAALVSAKASFDAGDAKAAQSDLQWIVDHTNDEDTEAAARLRLAGLLLDAKQFDQALQQLDHKHPASFDALFADLRGDVLVAQGKAADAKSAYRAALDKLPARGTFREIVQVKLDALGGDK